MEKLRDESEGYKLETARTHSKLRTLLGEMELVREREAARRAELRLSSMGAKCADQDSDQNIDHPRDRNQDRRHLDRDRNKNRDRDNSHVDKRSRERDRERARGRAPSVSTDADSDSNSGPTHNSSNSSVSRKDKGKDRERNRGRDGDGTVQSEVPSVQTVQRDRRDSFGIPHPRPLHTQSATPPRRPHYTVPSSPSSSSLSLAVIAGRVTYPVGRHSFSRGSSMDADIRSAASVTSTADSDCQSLYEGQGQAVVGRVGLEHSTSPATSRHFSDHDLQHYEKHSSSSNRSRGKGELSSAHTLDAVDAYPPRPPSQRDSCSPTGGDVPSSSFKMQRETDQPNIRISFNRLRDTNGIPSRSKDILMRDRNTDRDIDVVKGENTDTSTAKQPINLNSRIGFRSMVNSSMVERAERLLSREASEERHRVREPHPPPPLSLPLPTSVPTSSAYLREPGSPYNLRAGNTSPSCGVEPKPMSGMGPLHTVTNAPLTNSDVYGMDSASLTATAREREREVREKEREVKEKVQREKESEKESDEKVGVVARFDRLQSMFERVTGSAAPAMRRDSDSSDSDD